MNKDYIEFTEELHKKWIVDRLELDEKVKKDFQVDYLPEPYLDFNCGENPLYILTTNPGGGMEMQKRDVIVLNNSESGIVKDDKYSDIAKKLANFYIDILKGSSAGRRIDKMLELASQSHFDGIFQVESYPLHSATLPNKKQFLKMMQNDSFFREYTDLLQKLLSNKTTIVISATSSQKSISVDNIRNNVWLKWQSEMIGIDNIDNVTLIPLVTKDDKITSAFLYEKQNDSVKGFILTMGSNNLPSDISKVSKILS